jgi:hypothetical protein
MILALSLALCTASDVRVANTAELQAALQAAKPGTRILLAAGNYERVHAAGLVGSEEAPIVISAEDTNAPPRFVGGLQFSSVAWLEISGLLVTGASENGINIDDGGQLDTPSHHVVVRGVTVRDIGGRGNHDGIKLSGVADFSIERCQIERWGRGGSAIDMVGCRRGQVDACSFVDREDEPAANGVQAKGGTRDVRIRACRFVHAGQRAVNLGGSTGLEYFRPRPEGFEAKDVSVEGSTFVGSLAPIAFVGVDGASVRWNTFYLPKKWVARILQETRAEGFVPCRGGVFADNLVVYRASDVATAVNVGPGTEPDSFTFARNAWFCLDESRDAAPQLPVREEGGVCGGDPRFRDVEKLDLRLAPGSPVKGHGADAWFGRADRSVPGDERVPFAELRFVDLRLTAASAVQRASERAGKLVLSPAGPKPADEAAFASATLTPAHPFRDLLVSWNVDTPPNAGFRIEIRVARAGGEFSPWLYVGDWGRLPDLPRETQCEGAKIDTDFLRGATTFERAEVRVRAWSTGDARDAELVVARLALCFSDRETRVPAPAQEAARGALRLPVPPRSQKTEDAAIAGRICSPTSVAMVLGYRGASHPTAAVAERAFDAANDIYGNWPRNIQAAYSFGVPGYLTRVVSWREAEKLIRAGQPIIASIAAREGQLRGAPYTKTDGHLIVITGFDAKGGVHVNDPAVADPKKAQLVYAREDLELVWLQRGGTAYILEPKP